MKKGLIIVLLTLVYVLKMIHIAFEDNTNVYQFHLIPVEYNGEVLKYELVWYVQFLCTRLIDVIIAYILYKIVKDKARSIISLFLIHLVISIYHVLAFIVFYENNSSGYVLICYIIGILYVLKKYTDEEEGRSI